MSRFWAAASSSEGEQGSDSDSYDDEQPIQRQNDRKFGSTFEESDSESEDEVRVVKSQKDRAWDSMKEGIIKIRNARKNSDWPVIQDEFANVNKMIEKAKMLIIQSGVPGFYIRMLMEVEDHVQTALKDKESTKKMKPVVSRALNQMKLQVRKHNEKYKEEIADCRANPDNYEDAAQESSSSSESDSDSDSSEEEADEESEESVKPKNKLNKMAKVDDDSDEDSLFGDDDSDSDSESEDERAELKGRAKWLKKAVDTSATQAKDAKREAKKSAAVPKKKKEYVDATVKKGGTSWTSMELLTEEELDRKVLELISSRGRKNTDLRDVTRHLEVYTKIARVYGPIKEIPLLMHLISTMLDAHRGIDDYMDHQQWRTCYRSLVRVLTLLEKGNLVLGILGDEDVSDIAISAHLRAVEKEKAAAPAVTKDSAGRTVVKVVGNMESFILRLEDEYTKSLQQINPHTQEYVVRLADEAALVELAESVRGYQIRVGDRGAAASVSLLIVEHLYYKHDIHAEAVQRAHAFNKRWGQYKNLHPACMGKISTAQLDSDKNPKRVESLHPASFLGNPSADSLPKSGETPAQRLESLCNYIFRFGNERNKTRAMLCCVYHHALHDRFYKARDMFLISHIQDFVDKAEIKTQILYNRTVVILGLCAFRAGFYQKAHDFLAGICTGRVKELLAQGVMRWADKDAEQEKIERRRQMPYHMHINPDLLELCHLTCAMILELPQLAKGNNSYHSQVSKQFRKYLQNYSKQVFTGPPENTREHVLAATKALLAGDWRKALEYLFEMEVWKLIPNDGGDKAKEILRVRIKEEAVRAHLLLNSSYYESVDLAHICHMFDMEKSVTRRIISRMIFNKELSAAWEYPADVLVMYRSETTPIQVISQTVADKISLLLESNERILDPLVGLYGYKDDWNVRDNRRDQSGQRKNRNVGWKSGSQRPAPARNTSKTGMKRSAGGGGGKNAWGGGAGGNRHKKSGPASGESQSQSTPRRWGN